MKSWLVKNGIPNNRLKQFPKIQHGVARYPKQPGHFLHDDAPNGNLGFSMIPYTSVTNPPSVTKPINYDYVAKKTPRNGGAPNFREP